MEEIVTGLIKLVIVSIALALSLAASYVVSEFFLAMLHSPPTRSVKWGAIILSVYMMGWPTVRASIEILSESKH
jgi:hypothetical protein